MILEAQLKWDWPALFQKSQTLETFPKETPTSTLCPCLKF